ncbi:MAG: DUF2237 family protein [Microcoleaceae cyanobacterium]
MSTAKNVLGSDLEVCCTDPMTGFYRDGVCNTGAGDSGAHLVCAQVTQEFLEFSKAQGNNLITPNPMFKFPGLKPGDRWCLCVLRWQEALEAGVAPPVRLNSTHALALEYLNLTDLKAHALNAD